MDIDRPLERILDLARWAPSGDNTQPWRFEIRGAQHAVVNGFDTRDHCVYDLDGRPSQIALGALLETAAIAATAEGWVMRAVRRADVADSTPTFDLHFTADAGISLDPLITAIRTRSVQRGFMATRPLSQVEKMALAASVGTDFDVEWIEGWRGRRRMAGLLFQSARLRLVMPEAYAVHRDVIEWNARFSNDRVPDRALGVDRATLWLMRFAMKSWKRVQFLNRFMAGTWIPRMQMDFLPAIACAGHFVLIARTIPETIDDWIRAGRAIQRFWLTVTRLNLVMQPEVTPLIFSRYVSSGIHFSDTPGMFEMAISVAAKVRATIGNRGATHCVFMGRLGAGPESRSRSLRREIPDLMTVRI